MLQGMGGVDDSLSNLTSAISNEASINSSSNVNEMGGGGTIPQQHMYNPSQPPPPKKRRNLPGNPDPEAEVVALSPAALMATNRFVCEICNKGFQRDQNLQLHRRGHNLPWKLKQRSNKEVVRKKVYICPEPSCVHHDPARALGDLTGIKKHFFRKHGEKKWKCEKCSKRYAVQSDWKAHSKICGTREYRCDCGTLFSRRDSFITHRAFCDALAEESARAIPQTAPNHPQIHPFQNPNFLQLKQETLNFTLPSWLSPPDPFSENPSPAAFSSAGPSLMSATALLQKAAQMGVTMSGGGKMPYHGSDHGDQTIPAGQPSGQGFCATLSAASTAVLPPRDEFVHGLTAYENMAMAAMPSTSGFQGFEDSFNGMFNTKRNIESYQQDGNLMGLRKEVGRGGGGRGGEDGMTRDFLGLRAFPHRDFGDMAGLDQMGSSSSSFDHQNQAPWQS
ncbi:beta-galactosidase [Salvia divinorum]|uniref:Beta-galactosidase n=1 Tax=Salvia divinorum TaxID=28513 RepID=A0ABD1FL79_SALDI